MRGKSKTGYISQKAFPTWQYLDQVQDTIAKVQDNRIKDLLTLNLCCGYRIGELLNSYVYWADKDKTDIIVRAVVEKKKGTDFVIDAITKKKKRLPLMKMFKRGFLGQKYLEYRIQDKIFKSNKLMNIFDLDLTFLVDQISPSPFEPVFLFKYKYSNMFRLLKKNVPKKEVFYFQNWRLEEPLKVEMQPSFHFYRKAFASRLTTVMNNTLDVVNYMRWGDVNQALFYYKLYKEKDFNTNIEIKRDW